MVIKYIVACVKCVVFSLCVNAAFFPICCFLSGLLAALAALASGNSSSNNNSSTPTSTSGTNNAAGTSSYHIVLFIVQPLFILSALTYVFWQSFSLAILLHFYIFIFFTLFSYCMEFDVFLLLLLYVRAFFWYSYYYDKTVHVYYSEL